MPPSKSILQKWNDRIKVYGHITKPSDFIKILIGYLVIIIVSLSPAIVSFVGGSMEHALTGKQVNEGKFFMVFFWFMFYIIPFGIVLVFMWTSIVLKSIIHYFKSHKGNCVMEVFCR